MDDGISPGHTAADVGEDDTEDAVLGAVGEGQLDAGSRRLGHGPSHTIEVADGEGLVDADP